MSNKKKSGKSADMSSPEPDEDTPSRVRTKKPPAKKGPTRKDATKAKTVALEDVTSSTVNIQDDLLKQVAEMKAALKKAEADKAEMEKQIMRTARGNSVSEKSDDENNSLPETPTPSNRKLAITKIPRSSFNIQEAMGLSGSARKNARYKSIIRAVHELIGNARINWEVPWAKVPHRDKTVLFDVVRDRVPDMSRYSEDWATEAIAKQYTKNKRSYHYANGWLAVPEKWSYLKENAAKRTDAPRGHGKRKLAATSKMPAKRSKISKSKSAQCDPTDDEDDSDHEQRKKRSKTSKSTAAQRDGTDGEDEDTDDNEEDIQRESGRKGRKSAGSDDGSGNSDDE